MQQMDVKQARQIAPVKWTISRVKNGWQAHGGGVALVQRNHPDKLRVFRSLDAAISRLGVEVGVTKFKVIAD